MVSKFTNWLVKNNAIQVDEVELYEFAIKSVFLFWGPMIIGLIVGLICNNLNTALITVLPFLLIRKFSGGYHTRHWWSCMILSVSLVFFAVYCQRYIVISYLFSAIVIMTGILVCIVSPIDSLRRKLQINEKMIYKKLTISMIVLFEFIYGGLLLIGWRKNAVSIGVGVVLIFIMQIPCLVNRLWNKSEIYQNERRNG